MVLARTNEIKGQLGNKNIAISDEGLHVSVEERQEQRPDVGPIDISIGHDDDLAVTDFTEIEFIANPAAKGRDHGADFIVVQHLVQAGLLHVEDFAAQGQDGLEGTVTALFGAAASGVPFDDVDFRFFRILTGTVRQFPGRELTSSALLRRVRSRALRAAARARLERMAFSTIFFAVGAFSSKYSLRASLTILSTIPRTSLLPSLVFVCPSNCGSRTFKLRTQVRPSRTSSPERFSSLSFKRPFLRA